MTTILQAAHELHGGDETPQPMDCPVCEADIDYFIRYGEGRPDPYGPKTAPVRFSEVDTGTTIETRVSWPR